jgi:hypothetical protein
VGRPSERATASLPVLVPVITKSRHSASVICVMRTLFPETVAARSGHLQAGRQQCGVHPVPALKPVAHRYQNWTCRYPASHW